MKKTKEEIDRVMFVVPNRETDHPRAVSRNARLARWGPLSDQLRNR